MDMIICRASVGKSLQFPLESHLLDVGLDMDFGEKEGPGG